MANDKDSEISDATCRHAAPGTAAAGDAVVIPTLVVVAGSNCVGRLYRIDTTTKLTIGRAVDAQISLNDEGISRRHATVERQGDEILLTDLKSCNGTFVNGERIQSKVLRDTDKIQIGSTTIMKFSYQDSIDEALQKNLYESATRDPLTGIHNKKYFHEAVEKEFKFCGRHEGSMSVLMMDVDHFKQVNDVYGHIVGDNVLAHLAQSISGTVRSEDLFARWGGEEFIVLLRRCPRQNALDVAERMRALVAGLTFRGGEVKFKVTISIGVASYSRAIHTDCEALLKAADDQLYRAKKGGRNRVMCESAAGEGQES